MAFAVAVYAGDSGCCKDKDKAGCPASKVKTSLDTKGCQAGDKAAGDCCASKVKTSMDTKGCQAGDKAAGDCSASKMKTSMDTKGTCPFASGSCCKEGQAKKAAAKQPVLKSPKAAAPASY
jgi:hypothetical protein